jgi:probable addiction module antidote protein
MIEIAKFDAAEYLENDEDCAAYLEAALEDGDPEFFIRALGTVARARGMTQIARDANLGRESLYKAFNGDPKFGTVAKVLKALGLRLSVAAQ